MHASRMRSFMRGEGVGPLESLLWTGSLIALLVLGIAFELHYAIKYPYLQRTAVVEVVTKGGVPAGGR